MSCAGYILVPSQAAEQIPQPTTWQVMLESYSMDEHVRVRRD